MSRLQRAVTATLIVQAFTVAGMVLSLVTVPAYLNWLGQERYGLILLAMSVLQYLVLSDGGLSWASMILVSHAKGREDHPEIAAVLQASRRFAHLSAGIILVLTAGVGLLLALFGAALPVHPELAGLALAIGLQAVVTLLASPTYSLLNGLQDLQYVALAQGSGRIAGAILAIAAAAGNCPLGGIIGVQTLANFVSYRIAKSYAASRYPWAFEKHPPNRLLRTKLLRTAAGNFGLQAGDGLAMSAPVLALGWFSGAEAVPTFSVALTLIMLPLGVVRNFTATLQSAYGDAAAKGEIAWIAQTLSRTLNLSLLFFGLLAAGYLALTRDFVSLWTAQKLTIAWPILLGALTVGALNSLIASLQFTLTGLGRIRVAARTHVFYGVASLVFCGFLVWKVDPQYVGFGLLAAALFTNLWILPRELKEHLGGLSFWPSGSTVVLIFLLSVGSGLLGAGLASELRPESRWLALIGGAGAIFLVYGVLAKWLLSDLTAPVLNKILARWRSRRSNRADVVPT